LRGQWKREALEFESEIARAAVMIRADALAPHIAAAKEREEKLWALVDEFGLLRKEWEADRLAAILGVRP